MTSAPPPAAPAHRAHRFTVPALLTVGTILAVISIFAVFANRQVLNADNWADTSSQLLASPAVRTQVSDYLVDQVYSNVDVKGEVAGALPKRLQPLAGPAANGLRELAEKRMDRLLGRPKVQEAWKGANKITAEQFINLAEGNSKAVTAQGNAVVLNLDVILKELIQRLGLPRSLGDKVPASAGKITVMSSSQISTIQSAANVLKNLAIVLPVLAFGMFGLAVFLARDRRRHTLMTVGIDIVLAGVLVLIARRVLGNHVVDALATTDAVRPAAEDVWSIGTGILQNVAQAMVIGGIPIIFCAWLAGPQRPAVAFRRTVAPWLRESPGVTYGVVGAIVLLVIAWGPIPATQMAIPVLIMIALVVLGTEVLRRQTALEFPDATVEGTRASLSAGATRARRAVFGPHGATNGDRGHHAGEPMPDTVAQLERLSALHDTGALTDEEFAAEKRVLVGQGLSG
jgi:hypothetical protein